METLNEKAMVDKDVLRFFLDHFEEISEVSLRSIATAMVIKNSSKDDWEVTLLKLFSIK